MLKLRSGSSVLTSPGRKIGRRIGRKIGRKTGRGKGTRTGRRTGTRNGRRTERRTDGGYREEDTEVETFFTTLNILELLLSSHYTHASFDSSRSN